MIDFKSFRNFRQMQDNHFSTLSAQTDFEVVLIDLGLAKTLSQRNVNSWEIGNLLYWSPEATVSEREDGFGYPNSDIFAAAAIMITCFY